MTSHLPGIYRRRASSTERSIFLALQGLYPGMDGHIMGSGQPQMKTIENISCLGMSKITPSFKIYIIIYILIIIIVVVTWQTCHTIPFNIKFFFVIKSILDIIFYNLHQSSLFTVCVLQMHQISKYSCKSPIFDHYESFEFLQKPFKLLDIIFFRIWFAIKKLRNAAILKGL